MEVFFIKSPTGRPFFLAYSEGDRATLPGELANELITGGFAIPVQKEVETAVSEKPDLAEKAVRKRNKK